MHMKINRWMHAQRKREKKNNTNLHTNAYMYSKFNGVFVKQLNWTRSTNVAVKTQSHKSKERERQSERVQQASNPFVLIVGLFSSRNTCEKRERERQRITRTSSNHCDNNTNNNSDSSSSKTAIVAQQCKNPQRPPNKSITLKSAEGKTIVISSIWHEIELATFVSSVQHYNEMRKKRSPHLSHSAACQHTRKSINFGFAFWMRHSHRSQLETIHSRYATFSIQSNDQIINSENVQAILIDRMWISIKLRQMPPSNFNCPVNIGDFFMRHENPCHVPTMVCTAQCKIIMRRANWAYKMGIVSVAD